MVDITGHDDDDDDDDFQPRVKRLRTRTIAGTRGEGGKGSEAAEEKGAEERGDADDEAQERKLDDAVDGTSESLPELCGRVGVAVSTTLSDVTTAAIAANVVAQKLTAKDKPQVFLSERGAGGVVVKGPYQPGSSRAVHVLVATAALRALEARLGVCTVPPIVRAEFDVDGRMYLVYTNVLAHTGLRVVSAGSDEKIPRNRGAAVADRTSYDRRLSALEACQASAVSDDVRVAALQHLYARYVIGVGDTGLYNVLVPDGGGAGDGAVVVGVDFDDVRGDGSGSGGGGAKDPWRMLMQRPPAAAVAARYQPLVGRVKVAGSVDVGVALAGLVAARVLPGVKEYQRRAQAFQDALARVNLKAKKASKS